MIIRSFSEMSYLLSFEERFNYLKLNGAVGSSTFGYDRYMNQLLYKSRKWNNSRNQVIIRDNGCDLGIIEYQIYGSLLIHHMNPITINDIEGNRDNVFDPEFLITTTLNTHNAIHYGNESLLRKNHVDRTMNDTCPWL